MSDESADNDPKSSKKKTSKSKSKSKSSKSPKQKSSEAAARTEPVVRAPDVPESPRTESPGTEFPCAITDAPASIEQDVPDAHVTQPVIESENARHAVVEPVESETVEPARAVIEPVVAEPVVAEPVVAEPVVAEPVVAEPVVAEPVVAEPVVAEPVKAPATSTAASEDEVGGGGDDADRETLPPGWPEPAPRFVVSNVVTIILGIVAVGLVVGLVLTTLSLSNKNSLESARSDALNAARTYSIELSSYNYQHLNQDFATVESHATASFKKSFSQSSDALKSTLIRFKASSTATILASAVVTATTSSVVTLIFLSQTVTNSTQKTPTTDRTQIQMTLVNSGGQWLIDVVTIL